MTETFDWRAHLGVHPAAELLPSISEAELKELHDDIKANGLRTDIAVWAPADSDDKLEVLIDGRHRLDALAALGLLCIDDAGQLATTQRWLREGKWSDQWCSGDQWRPHLLRMRYIEGGNPYALVLSYNLHRRHLTSDQKRELIAAVLKAKPEPSNREIAKQVKTDHKTVADVRRKAEATGEIPQLEKTIGADGKACAATKPKSTSEIPHTSPRLATGTGSVPANARGIGLLNFDALILELLRKIKGQKPQRYVLTAVTQGQLGDLTHFLQKLIAIRGEAWTERNVVDRMHR